MVHRPHRVNFCVVLLFVLFGLLLRLLRCYYFFFFPFAIPLGNNQLIFAAFLPTALPFSSLFFFLFPSAFLPPIPIFLSPSLFLSIHLSRCFSLSFVSWLFSPCENSLPYYHFIFYHYFFRPKKIFSIKVQARNRQAGPFVLFFVILPISTSAS